MGWGTGHSESLAAASGRLLDRSSARLAEVIGPAGVQAIFLRAVKLRKPEFPFLEERIVPQSPGESLAESLCSRLQGQPSEVIQEASVILFRHVRVAAREGQGSKRVELGSIGCNPYKPDTASGCGRCRSRHGQRRVADVG